MLSLRRKFGIILVFMLHRRRKTKYRERGKEERLRMSRSGGVRLPKVSGLTARSRTRMLDSQSNIGHTSQSLLARIKISDSVVCDATNILRISNFFYTR